VKRNIREQSNQITKRAPTPLNHPSDPYLTASFPWAANGIMDLAVGAPKDTSGTGAVYILYLQRSTTTPVKGFVKISSLCSGVTTGTWLGRSLTALFDVNGDGGQ
jgi:hypothetical protein